VRETDGGGAAHRDYWADQRWQEQRGARFGGAILSRPVDTPSPSASANSTSPSSTTDCHDRSHRQGSLLGHAVGTFALLTARPPVLYAQSGGVHIAHQVVGEGGLDLVLVQGFASHLDVEWENPAMARFFRGLASFSRLIRFDKRGFGLSDRNVAPVPLEERMDDVRAVMDAVGSERAVLMGISEGVPMSILFAATYPERTQALVLYGGMARATEAPGYPWGPSAEGFVQASEELIMPLVYTGGDIDAWAPSLDEDPAAREWLGRYRRAAMSPDGIEAVIKMFLDIDVRHVLSTLHVPTLVLHRHGDRVVNWRASQWMADQIPGARRVELPGQDHVPWAGDTDSIVEEVRAFLTGTRVAAEPDRVLATVMFTDVVGSTGRAASLGDRRWKELLDAHDDAVRRELMAFRGREIKTTGDGFLATFDGPARGIRCARAIRSAATDLHIDVRVGLHTGEIELRGDDISGLAVHVRNDARLTRANVDRSPGREEHRLLGARER
jgi:pimeloyl-ACP methyl ester carboxylesterase